MLALRRTSGVPLQPSLIPSPSTRRGPYKGGEEEAEDEADQADGNRDALETLRERYARGDLTDEQFERKIERLLETDTLEDVEDRARERERVRE